MAGIRRHEDLIAWQLSYELKRHVMAFTARPAVARHKDFCKDIRRAARSAPANLAEAEFREMWRLAVRATGATVAWHQYLMSCNPNDPASWKHKPPADAIREPEPRTEPVEPLEPP